MSVALVAPQGLAVRAVWLERLSPMPDELTPLVAMVELILEKSVMMETSSTVTVAAQLAKEKRDAVMASSTKVRPVMMVISWAAMDAVLTAHGNQDAVMVFALSENNAMMETMSVATVVQRIVKMNKNRSAEMVSSNWVKSATTAII